MFVIMSNGIHFGEIMGEFTFFTIMDHQKVLVTSLITLICFSCGNFCNEKETNIDFFDRELGKIDDGKPILSINARFPECGEWGGHIEHLDVLQNSSDKRFELLYRKFDVNCDSMVTDSFVSECKGVGYFEVPANREIRREILEVDDNVKIAIRSFSQAMLESKFSELFPGHGYFHISMKTADSSLKIETFGEGLDPYLSLLKELKLYEPY